MKCFEIKMGRGATLRFLAETFKGADLNLLDAPCAHEGCIQVMEKDNHSFPLPEEISFYCGDASHRRRVEFFGPPVASKRLANPADAWSPSSQESGWDKWRS